jgi:hypothetical protein
LSVRTTNTAVVLQLNLPMAIDWTQWQMIWAAAGFLVASLPAIRRAVRRRLVRARLRQNLELAGAVRESGQPAADLDPVLTDLIAVNLANLARLEARRLPARRSPLVWRLVQAVSLVGWALAAAVAIAKLPGIRQDPIGLVISSAVVDAPLLCLAVITRDLTRARLPRGWAAALAAEETLDERTHDLAAELVPTLPLGRRNTLDELLDQRSELGTHWRTGHATVRPLAPDEP